MKKWAENRAPSVRQILTSDEFFNIEVKPLCEIGGDTIVRIKAKKKGYKGTVTTECTEKYYNLLLSTIKKCL